MHTLVFCNEPQTCPTIYSRYVQRLVLIELWSTRVKKFMQIRNSIQFKITKNKHKGNNAWNLFIESLFIHQSNNKIYFCT